MAGSYGNAINDQTSYESVGCGLTSGFGNATVPKAQLENLADDLGNICNQIDQAYKALVPLIEDCNNANGVVNDILNTLQAQGRNPVSVFELGKNVEEADITSLWNGLKGSQTAVSTNNPDNPLEVMLLRADGVKMRYSPTNGNIVSYLKFTKDECEDKISKKKITNKLAEQGMPCAGKVLDKMLQLKGFKIVDILQKYFGADENINITFKVEPNLAGTHDDAVTTSTIKNQIEVYLNPDLNNSTEEYILASLLHESVHAYLNILKINYPIEYQNMLSKYPVYIYNLPLNNNFNNYVSHVDMIHSWVNDIIEVVSAYNPNMNFLAVQAIAWEGLQGSQPYNLRINPLLKENITYVENGITKQTNKQDYYNSNERNTTTNRALGKKCTN